MNQMGTIQTQKGKVDVFFNNLVSIGIKSQVGVSIIALTPNQAVELADMILRSVENIDPNIDMSELARLVLDK